MLILRFAITRYTPHTCADVLRHAAVCRRCRAVSPMLPDAVIARGLCLPLPCLPYACRVSRHVDLCLMPRYTLPPPMMPPFRLPLLPLPRHTHATRLRYADAHADAFHA